MRSDVRAKILVIFIFEKLSQELSMSPTTSRNIQYLLAICLNNLAESKQSAVMLEKIVQLDREMLDPAHRGRLASQHELARAYMGIRQYEKAVELLQEVVQIRQTTLEPTHPYRLGSESLLSDCCSILRNDQNAQAGVSMNPLQETSVSKDEGQAVARGAVDEFIAASGSEGSNQVVAEDGVLTAAAPKRKKGELVPAILRRRRRW